ncbi:unknow [Vibrio parahaemolyticus]|nr:unknow [Vibrio parahaemolyticus]
MADNLSFSVAHLAAIQLPFSLVNSDTKKAQAMSFGRSYI